MSAIVQGAVELAEAGWCVFPCRSDKRPALLTRTVPRTPDPEWVCDVFEQFDASAIGALMGRPSGVWCLDVDVPSAAKPERVDGRVRQLGTPLQRIENTED